MAAVETKEKQLRDPPTDGISNVVFANTNSDLLAASSWDRTVRLYDTNKNALLASFEHKGAVLDCEFSADDTAVFSGGLDKSLLMHDLKTGQTVRTLGSHEAPIRCLSLSTTHQLLVSGGWDCAVSLWDPRAAKALTASVKQAGCKVYTMDVSGQRLVVGTSARQVYVYDVRAISTTEQLRESSLLNQTRCIRCFTDQQGFALSSTEGRVAIEYFDPDVNTKKKYAFKCHRKTVGKTQTLYPVNTMAFHPIHGTFATGGSDGFINLWDWQGKRRICQYPQYATSVASLDFNKDGTQIAVAVSYTFDEGDKPHPADAIVVRKVTDAETKPKPAGAPQPK